MKDKILAAMSGGVDSSVAAAILRSDFDVVGVTLKHFDLPELLDPQSRTCCTLSDTEDARAVANFLGIPHYVFNYTEHFKKHVIDQFVGAYVKGLTPNPCILCNRHIRFDELFRQAQQLGIKNIATGHYVRSGYDAERQRWFLKKAADPTKDQSYVLYSIGQPQLESFRFPLGGFTKAEIRTMAEGLGLKTAAKPDSQDICFVPDGDYAAFVRRNCGEEIAPGDFISADGKVLGRHEGIIAYTIGQRRGTNLALNSRAYVVGKDPISNTVTIGPNEALFSRALKATDINWVSHENPHTPFEVAAKTRYKSQFAPALATPQADGSLILEFLEPQRAVTPGQAVVLYDGDYLVAGGTITAAIK